MREHPKQTLHTWWTAERAGDEAAAERSLLHLFKALPAAVPPANFADRVLLGAGIGVVQHRLPLRLRSLQVRLAIAASLFLAGLAAAFLLPAVVALSRRITAGEVVTALAQGFSTTLQWLADFASVWSFFSQLSETLFLVVTTPPVALVLLTWALLATLAYRGLTELLRPRRSSTHAHA